MRSSCDCVANGFPPHRLETPRSPRFARPSGSPPRHAPNAGPTRWPRPTSSGPNTCSARDREALGQGSVKFPPNHGFSADEVMDCLTSQIGEGFGGCSPLEWDRAEGQPSFLRSSERRSDDHSGVVPPSRGFGSTFAFSPLIGVAPGSLNTSTVKTRPSGRPHGGRPAGSATEAVASA